MQLKHHHVNTRQVAIWHQLPAVWVKSLFCLVSLLVVLDGADNLEKSEVQAIIESTPELDMDLDPRGTRYRTDV